MTDQRMQAFWVASWCSQLIWILSAIFYGFRHWPSTSGVATGLKSLKHMIVAVAQFPSNDLGKQLQCKIFWVLMIINFFVGMGMLIQRQVNALTASLDTNTYYASVQAMVYVLIFAVMLVCPKSINPQSLLAWSVLYMGLCIVGISPLGGVPADLVRSVSKGTTTSRVGLCVACPSSTVLMLFLFVFYAYGSWILDEPQVPKLTAVMAHNVEGFLVPFAGLLFRFFLGEWVNVNIELQSQKIETAALKSLLTLLCDAVVELDQNLIICEHSQQLSTLLLQASSHMPFAPSLKGSPLGKFLPSESERERLEMHLRNHSQGGASAFHTGMVDALGNQLEVELLHVSFSVSKEERHLLVGIRESQKDASNVNLDRYVFEVSQEQPDTRLNTDNLLPDQTGYQNPMLFFSLDKETVLKTNEEWNKYIRPIETNLPMSQVLSFSSTDYDSFIKVLQIELNSLHSDSNTDLSNACRVVSFEDVPLVHFEGCTSRLKAEVKLFENQDGNVAFGILSYNLDDLLVLRLRQNSNHVPEHLNFLSPRSRSPQSASPTASRSTSRSSNKSSRSRRRRTLTHDTLQPDEGSILHLRNTILAAPIHL